MPNFRQITKTGTLEANVHHQLCTIWNHHQCDELKEKMVVSVIQWGFGGHFLNFIFAYICPLTGKQIKFGLISLHFSGGCGLLQDDSAHIYQAWLHYNGQTDKDVNHMLWPSQISIQGGILNDFIRNHLYLWNASLNQQNFRRSFQRNWNITG